MENNVQHPHGYGDTSRFSNNTIYIAKKNLELNKRKIFDRGHGLFKHTHSDLILTEKIKQDLDGSYPQNILKIQKTFFK